MGLFGVNSVRILIMAGALTVGFAADPAPLAREMLAAHNAVRKRVGVPPLVWSKRLQRAAQAWADTLLKTGKFEHNRRTPYGENLWEIEGAEGSPEEVVQDWASEASGYDHRSNTCRGTCGHYTQVVWRSTKRLGCAVARGRRRDVWVCEYDPPGNYVGLRPY
jgi:pathogenesis-related protein 1